MRTNLWLLYKMWSCIIGLFFFTLWLRLVESFLTDEQYNRLWDRGENLVAKGDFYLKLLEERTK